MNLLKNISLVFALVCFSTSLKAQYHLFNPKPDDALRPVATDRPDKTESPYTVDAGHYQVEAELYSISYDESEEGGVDVENEVENVSNLNLKAGLTEYSDLQIIVPVYQAVRSEIEGDRESAYGTGDTIVRYKYNFHGNDGGDFAVGVLPYVKVPTAKSELSNEEYEGGIMFPFAFSLPNDWAMGTMLMVDNRYNEEDDTRRTDYAVTWTFSRQIAGNLGGFAELFTQTSDDRDFRGISTFDLGLTYGVTDRVQLDAGAFIGLTEASEDLVGFTGVSALF